MPNDGDAALFRLDFHAAEAMPMTERIAREQRKRRASGPPNRQQPLPSLRFAARVLPLVPFTNFTFTATAARRAARPRERAENRDINAPEILRARARNARYSRLDLGLIALRSMDRRSERSELQSCRCN